MKMMPDGSQKGEPPCMVMPEKGKLVEPRRLVLAFQGDEGIEAARTALAWAMQYLVRGGDILTLLHVLPPSSTGVRRLRRLKGFQLALSLKELCDQNLEVKVEIVVREGDQGPTIVSLARELRAFALILGESESNLLKRVFRKSDMPRYCIKNSECQVLAVCNKRKPVVSGGSAKVTSRVQVMSY